MLDKNFKWLENYINKNKELILITIEDTCKLIRDKYYTNAISNIRKILEFFFINIENVYSFRECSSLGEKINALNKTYLGDIPSDVAFDFKIIQNKGNASTHSHKLNINIFEAVLTLNSLFNIFAWFYDKNDIEFDYEIYIWESKNISIVNIETQSINQKLNDDLKIEKNNLEEWLSNKSKIKIPIYQRNYVWNHENLEILFEDIKERNHDNKIHFFGSIAGKNVIENEHEYIRIIDGQQRLTTTIIIVCAARDVINEKNPKYIENNKFIPKILSNLSGYIENATGNEKGNQSLKLILSSDINKFDNYKDQQVVKNYHYMFSKFNNLDFDEIVSLINTYLKNFQLSTISFNEKTLSNKDEMIIFENINSKGKGLEFEELIQNYILNLCSSKLIDSNEHNIITSYNSMKEIVSSDKLKEFYYSLITYDMGSRVSDNNIENFKNLKQSLSNIYKNESNNIDTYEKYNKLIDLLKENIELYSQLISKKCEIKIFNFYESKIISCLMNTLENKKRKILITLMYLINDFSKKYGIQDKDKIDKLFLVFIKFIIKTTISTTQGNSDIKKYVINLIRLLREKSIKDTEFRTIDDLISYSIVKLEINPPSWWHYGEFKNKLKNNIESSNMITPLMMLINMDMIKYDENKIYEFQDVANYALIMPEYENIEWNIDTSTEEKREMHENKVNELGNFVILPQGKKNKNANKCSFLKNKNSNYVKLISPLVRNENKDIDIISKDNWTYNDIETRTNALYEYVTKNIIKG